MPTYEGLRLKVLKVRRNLFADIRRKGLEIRILQLFPIIAGAEWFMRVITFPNNRRQWDYFLWPAIIYCLSRI